jgi:hypothetical protein
MQLNFFGMLVLLFAFQDEAILKQPISAAA